MKDRRQNHASSGNGAAEGDGGASPVDKARASRSRDRRKAERVRAELHAHVQKAVNAIVTGASLFQAMIRTENEAELQKELHPDQAERLQDKLVDHVLDKLKAGVSQIADVGEAVAEKSTMVFGVVKGAVDGRIKGQQKVTVSQVVDAVFAEFSDKAILMQHALDRGIDALPREKLCAAAKLLVDAQDEGEAAARQDGGDSEERGDLGKEMRSREMQIFGLPATGLLAAEEVALSAYGTFEEQLRATMTAGEQVDAAQAKIKGGDKGGGAEARDTLDTVEEKMKPGFKAELSKERDLKGRADQVRS